MLLMGDITLVGFATFIIVAVLAFAYHEFAHAIVADQLGDPTARSQGRITLNPFKHLDKTGMAMLILVGFGWATTPVNPSMLRGNKRVSMAIVAVAGPIANLIMMAIFAFIMRLDVTGSLPVILDNQFFDSLWRVGVWLNALLFVFNLMPIPPLDGFTILTGILPAEMAYKLMPLRQYGMMILMGVIFGLPFLGIDIISSLLNPFVEFVMGFVWA